MDGHCGHGPAPQGGAGVLGQGCKGKSNNRKNNITTQSFFMA
jgi:hypothetical protein